MFVEGVRANIFIHLFSSLFINLFLNLKAIYNYDNQNIWATRAAVPVHLCPRVNHNYNMISSIIKNIS